MGYQLRLHNEIRAWLTDLRDTDPGQARLVGEALLALIDAGDALGPPLVVSLEQPDDPREALDRSYQRQLETLTRIRRGVADVATSRKRVDLQVTSLEQQADGLGRQREEAKRAGREDLADTAAERQRAVVDQAEDLRRQYFALYKEEERLTATSQRLQAKVEAFRTRKETLKANYTAAEASQRVREAMADLGEDAGEPEMPAAESVSSVTVRVTAQGHEILREIRDHVPDPPGGAKPGDDEDVVLPPGLMELRPGAPGEPRAGLLFVVKPQDTAVVLAYVEDPGGSAQRYRSAVQIAADRLPTAVESDAPPGGPSPSGTPSGATPPSGASSSGTPSGATPPGDVFTTYDADSFLDEFFPGAETEVEIAAGAVAARSRAHTLAEARQRMNLTQAQVARRMNVRQERISAIERAEPGATEVRTLAAYVAALGGHLEIVAHVGDDQITLR